VMRRAIAPITMAAAKPSTARIITCENRNATPPL
jgi:hypothetical protein